MTSQLGMTSHYGMTSRWLRCRCDVRILLLAAVCVERSLAQWEESGGAQAFYRINVTFPTSDDYSCGTTAKWRDFQDIQPIRIRINPTQMVPRVKLKGMEATVHYFPPNEAKNIPESTTNTYTPDVAVLDCSSAHYTHDTLLECRSHKINKTYSTSKACRHSDDNNNRVEMVYCTDTASGDVIGFVYQLNDPFTEYDQTLKHSPLTGYYVEVAGVKLNHGHLCPFILYAEPKGEEGTHCLAKVIQGSGGSQEVKVTCGSCQVLPSLCCNVTDGRHQHQLNTIVSSDLNCDVDKSSPLMSSTWQDKTIPGSCAGTVPLSVFKGKDKDLSADIQLHACYKNKVVDTTFKVSTQVMIDEEKHHLHLSPACKQVQLAWLTLQEGASVHGSCTCYMSNHSALTSKVESQPYSVMWVKGGMEVEGQKVNKTFGDNDVDAAVSSHMLVSSTIEFTLSETDKSEHLECVMIGSTESDVISSLSYYTQVEKPILKLKNCDRRVARGMIGRCTCLNTNSTFSVTHPTHWIIRNGSNITKEVNGVYASTLFLTVKDGLSYDFTCVSENQQVMWHTRVEDPSMGSSIVSFYIMCAATPFLLALLVQASKRAVAYYDHIDELANQPYYDDDEEEDPVDTFDPAEVESSDDADPVII